MVPALVLFFLVAWKMKPGFARQNAVHSFNLNYYNFVIVPPPARDQCYESGSVFLPKKFNLKILYIFFSSISVYIQSSFPIHLLAE
jgi:hypothetical protein